MPELPEVETTLRGIKPHIINQIVSHVIIRDRRLRWPIPEYLDKYLIGQRLEAITRRNKYLLFKFANGTLILHLGMSGRLCVLSHPLPPLKHDHVDIIFSNATYLRFTDPRRFGALLWTTDNPEVHELIANIGPEPLTKQFNTQYLWKKSRGKKASVKAFIMNGQVVAGVGNIYATEALFLAQISPKKPAGKVTLEQYKSLVKAIKTVLNHAIKKGGTTLRDFTQSDGRPGYFHLKLQVYGKEGEPCPRCSTKLKLLKIAQRSTVYCPQCQR